jgi:hypothetical protein
MRSPVQVAASGDRPGQAQLPDPGHDFASTIRALMRDRQVILGSVLETPGLIVRL